MKFNAVILLLCSIAFFGCSTSGRYYKEKDRQDRLPYEKIEENTDKDLPEVENIEVLEDETGFASYYSNKLSGTKTAGGEIYDPSKFTAAHRVYPFGTLIRVINLKNNKTVKVSINDRYNSTQGRIIDLSYAAAEKLGLIKTGIAEVKIEVLSWGKETKKK